MKYKFCESCHSKCQSGCKGPSELDCIDVGPKQKPFNDILIQRFQLFDAQNYYDKQISLLVDLSKPNDYLLEDN